MVEPAQVADACPYSPSSVACLAPARRPAAYAELVHALATAACHNGMLMDRVRGPAVVVLFTTPGTLSVCQLMAEQCARKHLCKQAPAERKGVRQIVLSRHLGIGGHVVCRAARGFKPEAEKWQ